MCDNGTFSVQLAFAAVGHPVTCSHCLCTQKARVKVSINGAFFRLSKYIRHLQSQGESVKEEYHLRCDIYGTSSKTLISHLSSCQPLTTVEEEPQWKIP